PPAGAAVFNVTKTADTNDGACNSDCSLREAIIAANPVGTGADTINVPAGSYRLTLAGGDNTAATGDLDIRDDMTIVGAGASSTVIDAGGAGGLGDRVFNVLRNPSDT